MTKPEILCIRAADYAEILKEYMCDSGLDAAPSEIGSMLADCRPYWIPREDAENDPTYLQIIPYVSVYASKPNHRHLAYQRKSGGEGRLEDKWSLGFGGHIEKVDDCGSTTNTIWLATVRELCEELVIDSSVLGSLPELVVETIIYTGDHDEAGPVDKVHLGVHMSMWVSHEELISPVEKDQGTGQWKWITEIDAIRDIKKFELWSRVLIEELT